MGASDRLVILLLIAALSGCAGEQTNVKRPDLETGARSGPMLNLVQYANPMCGTGTAEGVIWGDNNCFPGAVAPFGMLQWSPDTETGEHPGGYSYSDSRISDFSLDHISGAGCPYGADFGFMPLIGPAPSYPPRSRDTFAIGFSHTNECAMPGYYSVALNNGLKVELVATTRSGFGRFTFPANNAQAAMMVNAAAGGGLVSPTDAVFTSGTLYSSLSVNPAAREISGLAVGGQFCQWSGSRTVYFVAIFNQPFTSWSIWSDKTLTQGATNAAGTASGAYLTFDTSKGRTILAKVAISYVSIANARANLEAEDPTSAFSSTDFDFAKRKAIQSWNRWFNKIQIFGGNTNELQTFYSMLYHALQDPSVCSDVNGDYMGYDGKVHNADKRCHYGMFSGWDIYRSEAQLLAMIAPEEASDMAQSLVSDYQQGGAFPRWGAIDQDTGIMIGDPAAPIIADFYAFGVTNFDAGTALTDLVRAATDPAVMAKRTGIKERNSLEDYLKLGYVPEHPNGGYGSVSMTLEYAAADAALAQFAKALNDENDYNSLIRRAQNWRHLYNPDTGYFQMRRRDGSWAPGFTNNSSDYDNDTAYVEGTAGQYIWMVPFDLQGLVDIMGGKEVAASRLDAFFNKLNVGFNTPDSAMAWMGNEPCLVAPWIYSFIGQPYKTQEVVRRVVRNLYSPGPMGYGGNDDLGEMSSWYVFAALGIYPEIPGTDVLVLGAPLFPKAVFHSNNGRITIIGNGAGDDAQYVQDLAVNGRTFKQPWLHFSEISDGGMLFYHLSATPNINWGANEADAPPSYSDRAARTGLLSQ